MKLTHRIKLKLSHNDFQMAKVHSMEAARCWNDMVKLANTHSDDQQKWTHHYDLQKLLKMQYQLSSTTIQGLTDKFCANRLTALQLHKKGFTKARYAHHEKHFFCLPLKIANFKKTDELTLRITLSNGNYLSLPFAFALPSYGELSFKDGAYYFYYGISVDEAVAVTSDIQAGIDLGEVHSIAMVTSNGDALILSNRYGRSVKRYRNKKLGQFAKRLSHCKNGSKKHKQLIKARAKVKSKTKHQLRNYYHQTTAKAIDFAREHHVSEIVCGDIKNVAKNTKKKKRVGRLNRQKLSQAEFGTLKFYLKYKSKLNGIVFKLVDEAYTTQTCPVCGQRHKQQGRTHKCPCGYTAHRDIVGAWNILNKRHSHPLVDFSVTGRHPLKVSC